MRLNIWKTNKIIIDGVEIKRIPMNVDESAEFLFLFLPYLKLIKQAREHYKGDADPNGFAFILSILISEMDRVELYKALAILFHQSADTIKLFPFNKIIVIIPEFVKLNSLFELFIILKTFGAFN